jgi:hypothetical protein
MAYPVKECDSWPHGYDAIGASGSHRRIIRTEIRDPLETGLPGILGIERPPKVVERQRTTPLRLNGCHPIVAKLRDSVAGVGAAQDIHAHELEGYNESCRA